MEKKLAVGLCGIGRAGWNMHCSEIDSFPELFEMAAGCDPMAERRSVFGQRYPHAHVYASLTDMLNDPAVELVSIASPTTEHVEYACQALKAGKYVFLEKPVALNYASACELRDFAANYPGKLFIRHNRRFEAAFHHLQEIMKSGILGNIFEIKLFRHRFQLRRDWQTLNSQGGGQLNNWGPHLIDHVCRLMEAPVADFWADRKIAASRGDAEDHIKLVFRGENGRIIDLEISDGVTIPGPVYTVFGTRGTLISQDEKEFHIRYVRPGQVLPRKDSRIESPCWNSGYGAEFKVDWIDETIPVKPADGSYMTDIYSRVYETIRHGVPYPVTIDQAVETVRLTELVKKNSRIQDLT